MKKNLLVTLADKNYLEQAKQLFSSAYFNAGWQGDYMLLAHDISHADLGWFRNKEIMIKHCQPLYCGQVGNMPAAATSKFYLFTPEFKKWNNIVFLDVDILIRASLDELTKIKGLAAVEDQSNLMDQYMDDQEEFDQLNRKYDLKSKVFNTGVLAINTDLIEEETFNSLYQLMEKYKDIVKYGDQPILNLYFYKKWEKLLPMYNMYIEPDQNKWHLHANKIKGIVIHSPGSKKIWLCNNYFYKEWKENLDKADEIDLENIPAGNKWSKWQIIRYLMYLKGIYIMFLSYFYIDKKIGQLGLLLKKYFPRLYWALKKLKGQNKEY